MRSRSLLFLVAFAATMVSTPALAANDLILRQRMSVSSTAGRDPWEQTQYYGGALRVSDAPRFRSIIDLDSRTITVINKDAKTYTVSTFAEVEKRNDSHDKRVKDVPGPVRNMIHADVKVTLKPTGKSEKIAGFTAKEYSFDAPGVMGTVWISEDLDFGPRAGEWNKLVPIFGGQNSPSGHLEDAINQHKGVPMRRIVSMQPLPTTTTEVIDVRRGPIPPEMKAIPAGFTKVDRPERAQAKPSPTAGASAPKP